MSVSPMLLAVVLFALAAVNGLALATCFFTARPRPLPLAMIHLLFAASALCTLAYAVWKDNASVLLANVALGIMFVVALGGFVQLYLRITNRPLYTPLLLAHALGAITGFLVLLVAVMTV